MDEFTQARHDLAALQARYDADVARLECELAVAVGHTEQEEREELRGEAVFGAFDGMTSVTGAIVALASKPSSTILAATVGLAVASACGMGAGEWLSDLEAKGRLNRALLMGFATAVGIFAPAIPFFVLPKMGAWAVAGVVVFCLTSAIGHFRHRGWKGYLQTYGIIVVAGALTAAISLVIPSSGGG